MKKQVLAAALMCWAVLAPGSTAWAEEPKKACDIIWNVDKTVQIERVSAGDKTTCPDAHVTAVVDTLIGVSCTEKDGTSACVSIDPVVAPDADPEIMHCATLEIPPLTQMLTRPFKAKLWSTKTGCDANGLLPKMVHRTGVASAQDVIGQTTGKVCYEPGGTMCIAISELTEEGAGNLIKIGGSGFFELMMQMPKQPI